MPAAQELRALRAARRLPQAKPIDVELGRRGILRGFGLKLGAVTGTRFAGRGRELAAGHDMPATVGEGCCTPATGCASSSTGCTHAVADRPARCRQPAADDGRAAALYEAAHVMLSRTTRFSSLKRWALAVAKRHHAPVIPAKAGTHGRNGSRPAPGRQERRRAIG
jgi:hypothetical protein